MCYIDISSQENHIMINCSIAKTFGLETATYWAVLNSVLFQVQKKNKYDELGFFKLDRKYITDKTTLSAQAQKKIEAQLASFGILAIDPSSSNRLCVDVSRMLSYISNRDATELLKQSMQITKEEKKVAKAETDPISKAEQKEKKIQGMVKTMTNYLVEIDPDLFEAYRIWIDSMIRSKRLTGIQVQNFEVAINQYAQSNKQLKLDLLRIAAERTYSNLEYVVSVYNSLRSTGVLQQVQQKSVSNIGVDQNITF